jgi:hypothetical protein
VLRAMGSGDENHAVVYLLRGDVLTRQGMIDPAAPPLLGARLSVPGLAEGRYVAAAFDTRLGRRTGAQDVSSVSGHCTFELPPIHGDLVLALRRR